MTNVNRSAMKVGGARAILVLLLLSVALLLSPSIAPVHAQSTSVWTHVGAACVPDEDSAAKYEASAARFRHKGTNIGDIYARCNVVDPKDGGEDPNWNFLEVVYFDQEGANQVTAELVRVSNSTGGVYTIPGEHPNGLSYGPTFDSNDFPSAATAQTRSVHFNRIFAIIRGTLIM